MSPVGERSVGPGLRVLVLGFLAISIPIETIYSWPRGLVEPYYVVKIVGWLLLAVGMAQMRWNGRGAGVAACAAGWAWFGANFWRAVADRLSRLGAGESLPLGSIELWFAGACLLVSVVGLGWSLRLASDVDRPQRSM